MKDLSSLKEYEESWKNKHILECKNNIFENNLRTKELKFMNEKKQQMLNEIKLKKEKLKTQEYELQMLKNENKIRENSHKNENYTLINKNTDLKEVLKNNIEKVSYFKV